MVALHRVLTFLFFVGYSRGYTGIQEKTDEYTDLLVQRCTEDIELLRTRLDNQQKTIEELVSFITKMKNEKIFEQKNYVNGDIFQKSRNIMTTSSNKAAETMQSSGQGTAEFYHGRNFSQQTQRSPHPVRAIDGQVAFYAFMSSDRVNPSGHHTLLFDSVKTNVGNAYSRITGAFTVPSGGLYVFTTTIFVKGYMAIDILVNGGAVSTIFPDSGNLGPWVSATGIAVVSVNVGDVVLARLRSEITPSGRIGSTRTVALSSFSGWMIA